MRAPQHVYTRSVVKLIYKVSECISSVHMVSIPFSMSSYKVCCAFLVGRAQTPIRSRCLPSHE